MGGNECLDGGLGDDTVQGGAGKDTYFVRQSGDRVVETAGNGTDLIKAFVSVDLSNISGSGEANSQVENLRLIGGANLNATGNALNNFIYANDGQNDIDGSLGRDTLSYALVTATGMVGFNPEPMLTTVVDPDAPPVPRFTVLVTPVVFAPVPKP